jgi:glycosyltransferase involved in cell wall biosynthesis
MITCWYKNLSSANYSYNLCTVLNKKVDLKVISSHCACIRYFADKKKAFQSKCEIVSFPPYIRILESENIPKGFRLICRLMIITLQLLRGIAYLAKCKDVDIIHYQQQSAYSFGMAPLSMILLIPTKKIRVVTVHRTGLLCGLLSRLYRKADKIIVHSSDMKKWLKHLDIPECKITVVPHGAELPQLMGLPRKEITFFGAPSEIKGFITILHALKLLKTRGRKVHLNIYGVYSEEEKNKAMNWAKTIGVSDMLIWGGRLSEEEFRRKMQESIFTLAVYQYYVSGSSIITRAMGNATPVIASTVGAIPEYLKGAGLLVPKNDPEALADAMTELLDDVSLRHRFSREARKKAEAFSWDNIAKITLNIYYELMHQKVCKKKM